MIILCTVDITTREVTIPSDQRIASYDHKVDVIRFQVEAIPGFSLDTSSIRIAAQGPNKARRDYAVDPATVSIEEETGYITFDWPIPAGVTEMPLDVFKYGDKGQLIFAVCAEIIDGSTVSKAWHSDDGIITVVAHLEPEAGGGEDPEEEATNAQKIAQLQTNVAVMGTQVGALANGSPAPVATVSEMTDESAVYLYTGSETGYTAGNWYYYDGSAWTSGGTYGGAVTDTTLSISGAAADAKAVGEALAEKADADDVEALDTRVTAVEGDVSDLKEDFDYITEELGEPDDYHTTNLIDENALTQSKMIADDGSITNAPDNTWYVTDFLDVGHETKLYLKVENTSSNLLFCYDENQNPIGSRITSASDRLTSHTTYYDVALYPGTKYVRANVRTAWLGRYMLTKYFYPSAYVAAGTYANRTPSTVASKAQLAYNTYRTEGGIVRTYYSSWNAVLTNGVFSLLDMPQNTIAYVNLSQIQPTEIADLPFSSGAVYVEKVGRGSYSIYRVYKNGDPFVWVGFYISNSFVWRSMPNFNTTQIGMLGDSVTEGRIGGMSSITSKGIPYWVGLETGLKVTNLGVGNMGWASHQYLDTNAYEYVQTLDFSNYDVLTFQYGLNDGDIPLGDYLDTTEETIMGYVYKTINYVYTQTSNAQIIIINPTVGSKPDAFPYFNPDAHHSASDGWTFTEYFEQMKMFCDKYAIPLIDGWKGLNAWNRNTLIGDNVHPTEKGYQVLGRYIAGQIKSMI